MRDVGDLQVRVRVLQRVLAVLHRDHRADVVGRARPLDVRADVRREVAAGADATAAAGSRTRSSCRPRTASRTRAVSTRSCTPRLDQVRGDDRRGSADAARGVHAHDRLARRAERVGEVELGHHHALEDVGRGADDDGLDVGPRHLGVFERADRGLAARARRATRRRGTSTASSGRSPTTAQRSAMTTTPLPSSDAHEVLLQARARRTRGRAHACRAAAAHTCRNASPMRARPVTIIGLATSAPPDGLIATSSPRPSASASTSSSGEHTAVQLRHFDAAAADAGLLARDARSTASSRDRARPGSADRRGGRCPAIHAGRSHSSRARSPATSTTAAAPSTGGPMSCSRSGATT